VKKAQSAGTAGHRGRVDECGVHVWCVCVHVVVVCVCVCVWWWWCVCVVVVGGWSERASEIKREGEGRREGWREGKGGTRPRAPLPGPCLPTWATRASRVPRRAVREGAEGGQKGATAQPRRCDTATDNEAPESKARQRRTERRRACGPPGARGAGARGVTRTRTPHDGARQRGQLATRRGGNAASWQRGVCPCQSDEHGADNEGRVWAALRVVVPTMCPALYA